MLRALSLAVCMFLLAGCSTSAPPLGQNPTPTMTADPGPVAAPEPLLTDTLHLLDSPEMTALVPTGDEVIRVPVRAKGIPVSMGAVERDWRHPRPENVTTLTGSLTLWVDVQGTVSNPHPAEPCFWTVHVYVPTTSSGGGLVGMDTTRMCASEPAVVPVGVRSLQFTLPDADIPSGAGDTLVLHIDANGVLAPGASIDVLTGTPEYDSQLTLLGLQVELPTQALLV